MTDLNLTGAKHGDELPDWMTTEAPLTRAERLAARTFKRDRGTPLWPFVLGLGVLTGRLVMQAAYRDVTYLILAGCLICTLFLWLFERQGYIGLLDRCLSESRRLDGHRPS
jgi:hypothetical protein